MSSCLLFSIPNASSIEGLPECPNFLVDGVDFGKAKSLGATYLWQQVADEPGGTDTVYADYLLEVFEEGLIEGYHEDGGAIEYGKPINYEQLPEVERPLYNYLRAIVDVNPRLLIKRESIY